MRNLQFLTSEQVQQVHQETLRLLAEVGVQLTHPGAREMLLDHGAQCRGNRVLLPPDLVERCVEQCPQVVKLVGRDPDKTVELGAGGVSAHNVGGVPNVYELASGTRRPATREDNVRVARLLDALTNVNVLASMFTPRDVDADVMPLWMYFDTVANTTKPAHAPGTQTARTVRALAEMTLIACPGTTLERHAIAISPISPLIFPDEIVEALLEAARVGFALGPLPCPIMGATAPMSLAGALVQQNAEVLATIVLAQAVSPGLPMVYHGRLSAMNPRSGLSVWGNPEIGILSAATAQLGQYYNLPVNVYGLCTNALSLNVQNGYERAINGLLPVLAGADEISGVGEMDGGVMSSLAQIVIDNEILSSIRRTHRGFSVDEDALAFEVIKSVVDGGPGNFLAEMHTVQYLRKDEVLKIDLAERAGWVEGEAGGQTEMVRQADARASQLLAEHEVPPLSEEQRAAMLAVIEAAASEA
jgi:trimethylamine--corrinoid protein Co-methyltransferase